MAEQWPSFGSSSRIGIDQIPRENKKNIFTSIDYSISIKDGYWEKLIEELGFSERENKEFLLAFQKQQSPAEALWRECSYRNYNVAHMYQVFKSIGLVKLAEENLSRYRHVAKVNQFNPPGQFMDSSEKRRPMSGNSFAPFGGRSIAPSTESSTAGFDTIHFEYEAIKKGTNNFHESQKLGQGAFGKVYKVELKNTMFACKVLSIDGKHAFHLSVAETIKKPSDLGNELKYLAEYRHPNVIPLYGWSLDGKDPCLIYQFMQKGSLQDRLQRLSSTQPLQWDVRTKIACDAARGLQYLHTAKEKPLIHGDIKSANILLDESFTAKLGDFGLAREGPSKFGTGSYITLGDEDTPGTIGYLAKEYMDDKKLSVQVDTYAFGVVLLELFTGRRAFDRNQRGATLLRDYMADIKDGMGEGGEEGADNLLYQQQDPQINKLERNVALKFVKLALSCCHTKRSKRPSMSNTLEQLKEIMNTVQEKDGPKQSFTKHSQYYTDYGGETNMRSTNPPPSLGRQSWMTQNLRNELHSHNLSKEPVESLDTSVDIYKASKSVEDEMAKLRLQSKGGQISSNQQINHDRIHSHESHDSVMDSKEHMVPNNQVMYSQDNPVIYSQVPPYYMPSRPNNLPPWPADQIPPVGIAVHAPFYPSVPQNPHHSVPPPCDIPIHRYHTPSTFISSENEPYNYPYFPHIMYPPTYNSEAKIKSEKNTIIIPENQLQCITPEAIVSTPEAFSSLELDKQPIFDEPHLVNSEIDASQNNNNSKKMTFNTGSTSNMPNGFNTRFQPPSPLSRYPHGSVPLDENQGSIFRQMSPQVLTGVNRVPYPHRVDSNRVNSATTTQDSLFTAQSNFSRMSSTSSFGSVDSGAVRSTNGEISVTGDRPPSQHYEDNGEVSPSIQLNAVKKNLLNRMDEGCNTYSQLFSPKRTRNTPSEG